MLLRRIVLVAATGIGTSLAGCGGSSSTTPTPTPTPHAGATPTPGGGGSGSTATPGPINPCSLLTQQEASQMEGVTLGPGTVGGAGIGRICVYSNAATHTTATVGVIEASSVAEAQAAFQQEQASLSGFTTTQLPTFAGGAYVARKSDAGETLSGLYARDGSTDFFVTGTNPAPSDGALKVAALLVLGTLP